MTAVTSDLKARVARVLGTENVRTDAGTLRTYAQDATPLYRGVPDLVCFPSDADEVAAVIQIAAATNTPVIARGSGTNLSAATVPQLGGIVLVTTRMNRLKDVDKGNMLAVCQPGVTTAALSGAAAKVGLLYPPDPGSQNTSTIGGNVATCAGGLRGLKYGVTRDYLLGCEVVIGSGEVLRLGGQLVKDVAGLDLVRLMCGSEGTLGVLTELTLRLLPAPETSSTGLAYFRSLVDAARAVSQVLVDGVLPATLEFLDQTCLRAIEQFARLGLRTDAGALLVFGQDGARGEVTSDLGRIADACRNAGAIEIRIAGSDQEAASLLEARRAVLPSLSRLATITILEDATVPRANLAEMVGRIQQIAQRHDLLIGTFGHAGDGNLHPTCVIEPSDEVLTRVEHAFTEVFQAALELGGTITGEHGVGLAKLPHLESQLGSAQMALLRRLKAAFDPHGILNPGKLAS